MATASSGASSITTADHGVGNRDTDGSVVLLMAHLVAHNRHLGLLQDVGHVSGVTDFSPSGNVAVCANWSISIGQADGRHVLVELDRLLQFEHSNVIVEGRRALVTRVCEHSLDTVFRSGNV